MTIWQSGIAALATIGFVLPAIAQQAPQPQHTGMDPQVRKQIEELMAGYGAGFDKKDVSAVSALYTDDAVVVTPTSPTMVVKHGRSEIEQYLQYMVDKGWHIDGRVNSITPLGQDAAIVLGEYRTTGTTPQGQNFTATGYWTAVDVRSGDKWKIRLLTAVPTPRE